MSGPHDTPVQGPAPSVQWALNPVRGLMLYEVGLVSVLELKL